jgi:V8-like Glu-specific endopeptidase
VPSVGALFFPSFGGLGPALGLPHDCTASVVASPQHNLVLTAAHCIAGNGSGYQFAPGYINGRMPYGLWTVTAVYVNSAWRSAHDPQHDYAFLRIAPNVVSGRRVHVQDVTGANTLGAAPQPNTLVTVIGYTAGSHDAPLTCTVPTYVHAGYPAFDCDGYADGTSGSPWLVGTPGAARIVGVIGGLNQGGCTPATSYSSAFGADVAADLQRAESGAHADFVLPAGSDGCPA